MTSLRSTAKHYGCWCDEAKLLPASQACEVCAFSGSRRTVLKIQSAPDLFLLDCPRCHAASASRMPTSAALKDYYSTYYASIDGDGPKITFAAPERFAEHILCISGGNWKREIRIMDFGGGDGSLSLMIARRLLSGAGSNRQITIELIDFAEPNYALVPAGATIARFDSVSKAGHREYDLVLASSIMEHVPEARRAFLDVFGAVAAGGRLYARTPWIAPVFAFLQRFGIAVDFTYPAHVHDFGRPFWESVVSHIGLHPGEYVLRHSKPSPVETGWREAPLRTMAAYLAKAPAMFFRSYDLVGGWEVVFERSTSPA